MPLLRSLEPYERLWVRESCRSCGAVVELRQRAEQVVHFQSLLLSIVVLQDCGAWRVQEMRTPYDASQLSHAGFAARRGLVISTLARGLRERPGARLADRGAGVFTNPQWGRFSLNPVGVETD